MRNIGYIIIEKTDEYLRKYLNHPDFKRNEFHINQLRELFDFLNPYSYCGIGKTWLDSLPYFPDTNGQIKEIDTKSLEFDNLIARRNLAQIQYSDKDFINSQIEFYFKNLLDAKRVFQLMENQMNYEIISFDLETTAKTTSTTLGYDIGWLGGYSIICDTCVAPMWHPPDFNDITDLLMISKRLNTNCLFDNFDDAIEYKRLYETKAWGEKGEFEIYKIDRII